MNQLVKYIRWNDLKEYLLFSKATIYSLVKEGRFPVTNKLGVRVSAWSLDEVNGWLGDQINPTLTKLMLISNHGYSEKKEVKNNYETHVVELRTIFDSEPEYESLSNDELETVIRNCEYYF